MNEAESARQEIERANQDQTGVVNHSRSDVKPKFGVVRVIAQLE